MEHPQLPSPDSYSQFPVRRMAPKPLPLASSQPQQIIQEQAVPASAAEARGPVEYGRTLLRHKGDLLVAVLLGVVVAVLVTLPQTPVYQAQTSLEIQEHNENLLNTREVDPSARNYSSESDIQTQIELLQSQAITERVLAKLQKQYKAEAVQPPSRLLGWRKALRLGGSSTVNPRDQALGMAAGSLKVRVSGMTRIVKISTESTDPRLASDFANTVANEFIEQTLEWRWNSSQHTGDWLTRQLGDLRVKLETSEDQLQNYANQTNLMFTGTNESLADEKLRQLQEELSKAQAERMSKQSRYELVASSPPEALAEVLNDPGLAGYRAKMNDLQRQASELLNAYTPAHYKVRQIQSQINTLEGIIEKERGDILKRIRADYEAAARREKLVAAAHATQTKLVSEQSVKAVHYNILKREVDTNRQLYIAMLQKVKEYGMASAMQASNIRIIDPARPPVFPYKPNLMSNSLAGAFIGLLLGLTFVTFRERADRTLQKPGDAPSYLNLPELGVIPTAKSEFRNFGYTSKSRALARAETNGGSMLATQDGKVHPPDARIELVTAQRKFSLLAEAFRTTLTSVLFVEQNGSYPRLIVLTSPLPGDGKTTVITNLAIAMAEINRRVLLVDADMRKPRLHSIFGIENNWGLSNLLREDRPLDGIPLSELARQTAIPNLYILPSGSGMISANLLHSPRMQELLRLFRKHFHTTLIDTPPMLQISDARVLGRQVEGVILVLRSGKTTRDIARAASQRLIEDGTPILGTILNHFDMRKADGYGYGYGSQYYNSGYYDISEKAEQAEHTNAPAV